jgi:hypothetical protein
MSNTLHLVIPGLLGPWLNNQGEFALCQPEAPALEWLLARASSRPALPTADAALLQLFGVPIADHADLPVAVLTRLADGGEIGDRHWWLRADPVHLRPDLHGVLLADARVLAITPGEVAELTTAFNQTFAEDGLVLEAPDPIRWYLRLPADPGLRTQPLAQVIGRNLNAFMPYGSAARRWNGLLTEIQMLFHHHPVNRMREARDQPLINSVWFWGGGCCPVSAHSPVARLYASDPLTRGLAQLANATVGPVPDHAKAWLDAAGSEPDSLVVLETTRYDPADSEPGDWLEHIAELERAWFAPCRRLLQTGRLTALHLHPGHGCSYSVTSAARWRLWQRPRPLSRYFR